MHSGCHFHFSQSIYKHIQNLRLAAAYSANDKIGSNCRKLMALTLMPLDKVETSFYDLRIGLDSRVKQELRQLILCFDQFWMSKIPLEM